MAGKATPRQKMINVLYIIFIATLAMSLSQESLHNFDCVYEATLSSITLLEQQNSDSYEKLKNLYDKDPNSRGSLNATNIELVREDTHSLISLLTSIREKISMQADTKSYTPNKIGNKSDANVAYATLYNETNPMIDSIKIKLKEYRELILPLTEVEGYDNAIESWLGCMGKLTPEAIDDKDWGKELFDHQSAIGGIIILNRLIEGILLSESTVYLSQKDLYLSTSRESNIYLIDSLLMYIAKIESANMGTDIQAPTHYSGDSTPIRINLLPKINNRLYKGIENPLDITLIGLQNSDIILTCKNGSVKLKNGVWYVVPEQSTNETEVFVYNNTQAIKSLIGKYRFETNDLPNPTPHLVYLDENNNEVSYRGNTPISCNLIGNAVAIRSELSDINLNTVFKIVSFNAVCVKHDDTAVTIASNSEKITAEQLKEIKTLTADDKLYFTSIVVADPTGKERILPPIVVILN